MGKGKFREDLTPSFDLGNWGGGRGGVVAVLFAARSHKHQGTEMVSSFHPRDPDRGGWGKNNLSLLLE